jgi:hypothetical protein
MSYNSLQQIIIEPKGKLAGFQFRELWQYRELLRFLVVRDIKVRYKQTVRGGLWAILQPFMNMVIFTIFFGHLAKIPPEGRPYPIFVSAALRFPLRDSLPGSILAFCYPGHIPGELGDPALARIDQFESHGGAHHRHVFLAAEPEHILDRYLDIRNNQLGIVRDRYRLF